MKAFVAVAALSFAQIAWSDPFQIVLYPAFACQGASTAHVIEGRIIDASERTEPAIADGKRENLRRMQRANR